MPDKNHIATLGCHSCDRGVFTISKRKDPETGEEYLQAECHNCGSITQMNEYSRWRTDW